MHVTVLFFAQARERAGRDQQGLDLPEGSRVGDLLAAVRREHPRLADLEPHLAVAVDGRLAAVTDAITHGAEIALLPPVSGG
jgi:molybdopterin synthase catalytic subunit